MELQYQNPLKIMCFTITLCWYNRKL